MTVADIFQTKSDLYDCVGYIQEVLNRNNDSLQQISLECIEEVTNEKRSKGFVWGLSSFKDIDTRLKELCNHAIISNDIDLALELASVNRACFVRARREWSNMPDFVTSCLDCQGPLLTIELWLKECYFKIPRSGIDNYYIRDCKLLEVDTNIEVLAKPQQEESTDNSEPQQILLPHELDTERARIYFARALEAEFMERTPTGYTWLYGGNRGKARLAYFLERVFCVNRTDTITLEQRNSLENLFNVRRLDRALSQNCDVQGNKAVTGWRNSIDRIFQQF